jgi:hypothetical protein
MYQAAGPGAGGPGGPGPADGAAPPGEAPPGAGGKKKDVIDAEFEESP